MFSLDWQWFNTVSNVALIVNIILAAFIVIFEKKGATAIWAWLMVLFFLPIIGFFHYLLLGRSAGEKEWSGNDFPASREILEDQKTAFKEQHLFRPDSLPGEYSSLVGMLLNNDDSPLSRDNKIQMYTDGHEKFEALFKDIEAAREHIHLQYYIMREDRIGSRLRDLLTEKAKAGVKVRFLYDGFGSRKISRTFFSELHEHGGETQAFSPLLSGLLKLRLNFRNHRKLAVIDGKVGYMGGYNVGDEYLGRNKELGYWRDTHLRMEGSGVHLLQERFISDWNKASRKGGIGFEDHYFPEPASDGDMPLQLVSSGPDARGGEILNGFIKIIQQAEDYIYIQTPYFVPTEGFLASLHVAALSGVDVRIMIPNKPDHPFVYPVTFSFVGEMMQAGAKTYIYDEGFLHAKTIVVDGKVSSVGTANVDMRSAELNFELNTFIYHEKFAEEMKDIFRKDMAASTQFTEEMYNNRSFYKKVKESVSRLLAPLL
ncbi:cardiolipin synthase [Salinicoccus sp. HZC-1]|uniref:cardiolipin synthase n=1 Tax=Salinicoccus sp. HZC-1 TaxID=3385497 RepID=UPI00398AA3E8